MANKKDNKVQKKLLKKLIKKEKKKPNEADTINKYKKQLEKTKLGVALKLIKKEKLAKESADKIDADAKLKNDAEQNQIQNQLVQRELIQKYRDFQPKLSRDDLIKYIQERERFLLPLNIEIPKVSNDAVKTFEARDKKEKKERQIAELKQRASELKQRASVKKSDIRKEVEQKKIKKVVDETKRLKDVISEKNTAIAKKEGVEKLIQAQIDHRAELIDAQVAYNDIMTSIREAPARKAALKAEKKEAERLMGLLKAKSKEISEYLKAHPKAGLTAEQKVEFKALEDEAKDLKDAKKAIRGVTALKDAMLKENKDNKILIEKSKPEAEALIVKLERSPLNIIGEIAPYDRTKAPKKD